MKIIRYPIGAFKVVFPWILKTSFKILSNGAFTNKFTIGQLKALIIPKKYIYQAFQKSNSK